MNPTKVYLDVAGTDRSSLVLDLPKVSRPLSAVGGCKIVVSNKGGAYKSSFSEQQRVAVSAARAVFPFGDYFTGTDGAAPNAAKWDTAVIGGSTQTIDGNKLKNTSDGANESTVNSHSTYAQPYALRVWVKSSTLTNSAVAVIFMQGGNYVWMLRSLAAGQWNIYTTQATVWGSRATGGTFAADTWYMVECRMTSTTSVTIIVYDVNGVVVWNPGAQTFDATAGAGYFYLSRCPTVGNTYWDSFLMTSSATVLADQLFEGVVDSIEYNSQPDTITLHCVDDAWELAAQYDDTYGRTTAQLTPAFGATDDISAYISALLSTGWTYTCPDCAIHDYIEISIGTRRIDAINQVVEHTPYLGWFVLPMKHIVFVMPDTSPAPDAWTEATAGWTTVNCVFSTVADPVDGVNVLSMNPAVVWGSVTRGDALGISLASYRFIVFYYFTDTNAANSYLIIWDNVAGGTYWTYTLPIATWGTTGGSCRHMVLRLPDSLGNHGWVPTGSPNPAGSIQRIVFQSNGNAAGSDLFGFDVLYFVANKKLTSKYTLTNIIAANHKRDADQIGQVIVQGSGISAVVCTDTTVTATYGTREQMWTDLNLTVAQKADAYARAFLNAQDWDDTADPIIIQVVNPGDTYNVMPGDTITVTAANLNLSAATRTMIMREDSIGADGWLTSFLLSTTGYSDRIMKIWEATKRKRY